MAGFRWLCGRFCCATASVVVDGRVNQNGAKGAKFKRLRRFLWRYAALVGWSAGQHDTRL